MLHKNNGELSRNIWQSVLNEISTDHLKAIIDQVGSSVSIAVFSNDGSVKLVHANNQYYELFGYVKKQLTSELKDPQDIIYPDDREFVSSMMAEIISTHKTTSFQYRIIKRDSSVSYIQCCSSMSLLGEQQDVVLLFVLTDISDIVVKEKKGFNFRAAAQRHNTEHRQRHRRMFHQ